VATISIAPGDRLFILTGAGVSAESGIPTFRDAGGLWGKYRIEEVASPYAWRRDPRLVWDFYSMRRRVASEAKPNPGHFALAALERTINDRFFLCTQNVDNLHELAGSQRVLHMHGELFKSRCDSCDAPPFDDVNLYESPADLPRCSCGALIRPNICWFGETPFHLDHKFEALRQCTLFAAIGTSGTVKPGKFRFPSRGWGQNLLCWPGSSGKQRHLRRVHPWKLRRTSPCALHV